MCRRSITGRVPACKARGELRTAGRGCCCVSLRSAPRPAAFAVALTTVACVVLSACDALPCCPCAASSCSDLRLSCALSTWLPSAVPFLSTAVPAAAAAGCSCSAATFPCNLSQKLDRSSAASGTHTPAWQTVSAMLVSHDRRFCVCSCLVKGAERAAQAEELLQGWHASPAAAAQHARQIHCFTWLVRPMNGALGALQVGICARRPQRHTRIRGDQVSPGPACALPLHAA